MNVASVIVVGVLFALVGLTVWRNIRKVAPCACGSCGACKGGCHCHGGEGASSEK